jgi:hypothetical protein
MAADAMPVCALREKQLFYRQSRHEAAPMARPRIESIFQ